MNEEQAKKYLKRKGKEISETNVDEIVRKGKIYGDPVAQCQ